MTAADCLSKADQCTRMADYLNDPADRRMVLVTAEYWRTLARTAKRPSIEPLEDSD